jgi:hypothetical protein
LTDRLRRGFRRTAGGACAFSRSERPCGEASPHGGRDACGPTSGVRVPGRDAARRNPTSNRSLSRWVEEWMARATPQRPAGWGAMRDARFSERSGHPLRAANAGREADARSSRRSRERDPRVRRRNAHRGQHVVPETGIEPVRPRGRGIFLPLRLSPPAPRMRTLFGVWSTPSPWPRGGRCPPSALYTFPRTGRPAGLARRWLGCRGIQGVRRI